MISSTTCSAAGVILAGILIAGAARADAPKSDSIAAQALFKEARALVDAGKWAEGCPKFEASLAAFPSASTMLNIAKCHEHDGKIASAWQDYNQALTLNRETKGDERRKGLEALATKGIAALEPRLPRLKIVVKGAPSGLEVLRDGKEVPVAALGEALPADPGAHEIRARAPGFKAETRTVTLEEKKTATVEIEMVADASAKGADQAKPIGIPIWAWIVGGAGLGLAGAGAYFLADDLSAIHALRTNCREVSGTTRCDPGYDFQRDNARKNRGFALAVGLGGAGVLAVGAGVFGIVRGLTVKKAEPTNVTAVPWFSPGAAGAAITGRF
ncbi:MAG: hypothetical protein QM820_24600 [Minicystis sp.]